MLYSQQLRLLASWMEDHPKFDEKESQYWNYPSIWGNAEDEKEFGELCRAMGKFEKNRPTYGDSIEAVHAPETDGDRIFKVTVSLSGVCQKVPRLNDDGTPVTRTVTKTVPVETREETEEVPEFDWHCPQAWLNL